MIKKNVTYKKEKGFFHVDVNIEDIKNFLDFIQLFKTEIQDLEIKKGTLNDVFLEITGKEIREETSE